MRSEDIQRESDRLSDLEECLIFGDICRAIMAFAGITYDEAFEYAYRSKRRDRENGKD